MPQHDQDPNLVRRGSPPPIVRPAGRADAASIRAIYNHEAEHELTVFDLRGRTLSEQEAWIADRTGVFTAIVAERDGEVVGFGSLSPYRTRPAYSTTVENSVYVDREARGGGVGGALLGELMRLAEDHGFHSVIARIAGGNEASVALHERLGFEIVGTEREVGRKLGNWLDVLVMQYLVADPGRTARA